MFGPVGAVVGLVDLHVWSCRCSSHVGAVVGLVDLHVWSSRCSSRFGGPTCLVL